MKSFKKLAGLALALIMALALMAPAFAAGEKTITVKNASNGVTYNLYKVFSATVSDDRAEGDSNTADGITYSYDGELPADLAAAFEKTNQATIKVKTGVSEEAAFAALKTWAAGQPTPTGDNSKVANGGAVTFTGLDDGYYVILAVDGDSTGNAVTVTSIAPNAVVYDKNEYDGPDFKENEGKKAYAVGENNQFSTTVQDSFNIGDKIGYVIQYETKNWLSNKDDPENPTQVTEYKFVDTIDPAKYLTGTALLDIKVGNTTLTADKYDYSYDSEKGEMTITIPWAETNAATGAVTSLYADEAEIVIRYTGTVNMAGKATNKVDAYINGTKGTSTTEEVFNTEFNIFKFTGTEKTPLEGAAFTLQNASNLYYKWDDTKVTWVSEGYTTLTSDTNGNVQVHGLPDGTYTLTETAAPEGYNKLTDSITIQIVAEKAADDTTANKFVHATSNIIVEVENQAGTVLPDTGGIGTTIFYTLGGLLLVGSVILFVTKKRTGMAD